MKGAVGNFPAPAAFAAALELKEMGAAGTLAGAKDACRTLEEEVGALRESLEAFLAHMRRSEHPGVV